MRLVYYVYTIILIIISAHYPNTGTQHTVTVSTAFPAESKHFNLPSLSNPCMEIQERGRLPCHKTRQKQRPSKESSRHPFKSRRHLSDQPKIQIGGPHAPGHPLASAPMAREHVEHSMQLMQHVMLEALSGVLSKAPDALMYDRPHHTQKNDQHNIR